MRWIVGRLTMSLILASGFWIWTAVAQTSRAPSINDADIKQHRWIILLDASASFTISQRLSEIDTRADIRDEALFLMQNLLAILKEMDPDPNRKDFVVAYRFGRKVENLELPSGVVTWKDFDDDVRWQKDLDPWNTKRTALDRALEMVKQVFESDDPRIHKHVILISDGELDIGRKNRSGGTPPDGEELIRYREILRREGGLLRWFIDNKVTVHALTVDRNFEGNDDTDRQKTIRRTLKMYSGQTPVDRALRMVEDLVQVKAAGIQETEGPYVMQAIADVTGGKSRSVNSQNLLNVLWEVILPAGTKRQIIPPNTRTVYVFAHAKAQINVIVGEHDKPVTVSLGPVRSRSRADVKIDPPTAAADVDVSFRATDIFVTWQVAAKQSIGKIKGEYDRILSLNDLRLRWQPNHPPQLVYAGRDVPLHLDLVRRENGRGWRTTEWRDYFKNQSVTPKTTLVYPDQSTSQQIPLSPVSNVGNDDTVLSLSGKVLTARTHGRYRLNADISIATGPNAWLLKAPETSFVVIPEPKLVIRHVENNTLGDARPVILSEGKSVLTELKIAYGQEAHIVFEQWLLSALDPIRRQLSLLTLPGLNLRYSKADDQHAGKMVGHDNQRVIWRSPVITIPHDMLGRRLAVSVDGGAGKLNGSVVVRVKPPPPPPLLFSRVIVADQEPEVQPIPLKERAGEGPTFVVPYRSKPRVQLEVRAPTSAGTELPDSFMVRLSSGEIFQLRNNELSEGLRQKTEDGSEAIWRVTVPVDSGLFGQRIEISVYDGVRTHHGSYTIEERQLPLPKVFVRPVATVDSKKIYGNTEPLRLSEHEELKTILQIPRTSGASNVVFEWHIGSDTPLAVLDTFAIQVEAGETVLGDFSGSVDHLLQEQAGESGEKPTIIWRSPGMVIERHLIGQVLSVSVIDDSRISRTALTLREITPGPFPKLYVRAETEAGLGKRIPLEFPKGAEQLVILRLPKMDQTKLLFEFDVQNEFEALVATDGAELSIPELGIRQTFGFVSKTETDREEGRVPKRTGRVIIPPEQVKKPFHVNIKPSQPDVQPLSWFVKINKAIEPYQLIVGLISILVTIIGILVTIRNREQITQQVQPVWRWVKQLIGIIKPPPSVVREIRLGFLPDGDEEGQTECLFQSGHPQRLIVVHNGEGLSARRVRGPLLHRYREAVELSYPELDTFQLQALNGTGWSYRMIRGDGDFLPFTPLPSGRVISFNLNQFIRRWRLEIKAKGNQTGVFTRV